MDKVSKSGFKERFIGMKAASGTHSPSIKALTSAFPEVPIKVDACFLSNPFATQILLNHLEEKSIFKKNIQSLLESYPSQNHTIAEYLTRVLGVPSSQIFVSNGATEAIQAVLQNFVKRKIILPIPTFSCFYEFAPVSADVVFYPLYKKDQFEMNADHFVDFCNKERADTVVLINPNNPDGSYLPPTAVKNIVERLKTARTVIIDESFVHFSRSDPDSFDFLSVQDLVEQDERVVIVKSMSKDFGIPGLRCGYALMSKERVALLLRKGYLWNVNSFAQLFLEIHAEDSFQESYRDAREKFISVLDDFKSSLSCLDKVIPYPSQANFVLLRLPCVEDLLDFTLTMFVEHGVYIRNCADKIGLDGNFIRVACRTPAENSLICKALQSSLLKIGE